MKQIIRNIIVLLAIVHSSNLYSQDSNYRRNKEAILNCVLNSSPFDTFYQAKKVLIKENELLNENLRLKLKRKNCKVYYIKKEKISANTIYVALGDFTTDESNFTTCRVQIELMPQGKLLNLFLKKENDEWLILNHTIVTE